MGTLITETDFDYTGQRNLGGMGLMDYNARFYSPLLGRFVQPDSIVPNPGDSQAWNRYAYALNNPIKYNDPSGNCPWCFGAIVGAVVAYGTQVYDNYQKGKTGSEAWTSDISLVQIGVGAVIGAGIGALVPAVLPKATQVATRAILAWNALSQTPAGRVIQTGVEGAIEGCLEDCTLENVAVNAGAEVLLGAPDDLIRLGRKSFEGEFSISNWDGYPDGDVPKPGGPFRLLYGEEYQNARKLANKANAEIHKNPAFDGLEIHEIQPVKFGGDPISTSNKIALDPLTHSQYTTWWNKLQRILEQ